MSFAEQLHAWREFFVTSASVAAVLLGLLFVGITLRRDEYAREDRYGLYAFARVPFGLFLATVVVSLLALIPGQDRTTFAVELVGVAVAFAIRTAFVYRLALRAPGTGFSRRGLVARLAPGIIGMVGLVLIAAALLGGSDAALYGLAAIALLSLVAATYDTFDLLLVGDRPRGRGDLA